MSAQKKIVETYMDGFRTTDHAKILDCLTEDVIWEMPGFFTHHGKAAFDREIENPDADGHPQIVIKRLIEEGSIVAAEGTVNAKLKSGNPIEAVFCDVFHFREGKIARLITYLMFNRQ
jgi:ketosteroid isomerase-like protein